MPGGYEGDYTSIVSRGDTTGTVCGGLSPAAPRATGAKCYAFTYTVPGLTDAGLAPTGFAAVVWQSDGMTMPAGGYYNFGTQPGVIPPAGATEASFWAKGAMGGEMVSFGVGSSATGPCPDSVAALPISVTLTKTWTRYTIPFPTPVNYAAGQVSGFDWDVASAALTPGDTVSFFIDAIEWDNTPDADN